MRREQPAPKCTTQWMGAKHRGIWIPGTLGRRRECLRGKLLAVTLEGVQGEGKGCCKILGTQFKQSERNCCELFSLPSRYYGFLQRWRDWAVSGISTLLQLFPVCNWFCRTRRRMGENWAVESNCQAPAGGAASIGFAFAGQVETWQPEPKPLPSRPAAVCFPSCELRTGEVGGRNKRLSPPPHPFLQVWPSLGGGPSKAQLDVSQELASV